MPFSVSTRSAVDGTGTAIPGGVVFIDESGTGVGPWIIAKTTIDPAGVNVQFVLSNNAAKCDLSSINGVALGSPSAYGTAPGAVNVSGVNAFVTNTVAVSGTVTSNQGGAPWTVNPGTPANWGIGATAAAVPANAVAVAGDAMTALPTATAAGQLTDIAVDKFGRPVVLASSTRDNIAGSGVTTITTTTETTIIAAGAAGVFNDIHTILVSNTSATDVRVDIRDSTAGTIQFTFWAKANTNTVGFSSTVPWPQTTAANAWTAQLSAAVTDVRISALFVKNK